VVFLKFRLYFAESGDETNAGLKWCNSAIKVAMLGRHLTKYSVGLDAHLHHSSWSQVCNCFETVRLKRPRISQKKVPLLHCLVLLDLAFGSTALLAVAVGCSLLVCFPIEKGLGSTSAQFYSISPVFSKLTKYRNRVLGPLSQVATKITIHRVGSNKKS
jgi:hypothetical protein